MNGVLMYKTSSPVCISVLANRPVPIPSGARPGVAFVERPGRSGSADIFCGVGLDNRNVMFNNPSWT